MFQYIAAIIHARLQAVQQVERRADKLQEQLDEANADLYLLRQENARLSLVQEDLSKVWTRS